MNAIIDYHVYKLDGGKPLGNQSTVPLLTPPPSQPKKPFTPPYYFDKASNFKVFFIEYVLSARASAFLFQPRSIVYTNIISY